MLVVSGNVNDSTPDTGTDYYLRASESTKSIISFVKVAYPDMVGARGPIYLEELYDKDRKVCR